MKKNNQEVVEVEAEEMLPEMELEKTINTELVKANVTEQVIAALKEKYGGLVLKSVDDKESYLELKASKREVAKVRILAEKITKRGRESAIKIQRLWLAKEKEVVGKIDEVESHLANEIKKFDDEVERKENEERIKREEAFIARQASLLKYGAEYKNGNYELGEISYEIELIKQADSETWDEVILPKFKRVYDRKEAALVAEEAKRKEENDRLKAEQDKFAEEQRKFKEQQDLFEKQKRELQEQKDKQDKEIREAEQKRQHDELQKRIATRNGRIKELKDLGCTYDAGDEAYIFNTLIVVSGAEIENLSEKEWIDLVNNSKPLIEKIKKEKEELETRRQTGKARFEILRNMGFETESEVNLSTITDGHWQTMYAGYRKAYDDKKKKEWEAQQALKKQLEDEEKQKELDASNDKTKYADVVKYISACPIYEMKSSLYKSKMNIIKDFIADLKEN